jgi:hypothetical protein
MPFLAITPTSSSRPIWLYRLSDTPLAAIANTAAASPKGTVSSTTAALVTLSNCATSTRKTTSSAMAKVICHAARGLLQRARVAAQQQAHAGRAGLRAASARSSSTPPAAAAALGQRQAHLHRAALAVAVELGGDRAVLEMRTNCASGTGWPAALRTVRPSRSCGSRTAAQRGLQHDRHAAVVDRHRRHLGAVDERAQRRLSRPSTATPRSDARARSMRSDSCGWVASYSRARRSRPASRARPRRPALGGLGDAGVVVAGDGHLKAAAGVAHAQAVAADDTHLRTGQRRQRRLQPGREVLAAKPRAPTSRSAAR